MKVLIACEFSQVITRVFRDKGHDAYSCDLLQTEGTLAWHILGDVLKHLEDSWGLMIAHPPCTFLAVSGAAWFDHPRYPNRRKHQQEAVDFFMALANAPIERICIENPVSIMSTVWRKPDQIIQPYYFGDEASKTTCLWLKNLPKLRYGKEVQIALGEDMPPQTEIVSPGEHIIYKSGAKMPKWYADARSLPQAERQAVRSKTFQGIAEAMAEQWGSSC